MRILLIYPGATWSPYDVATGYAAAFRALGHQVISFDYHTQYKFYQQYLGWLSEHHGASFPREAAVVLASERVAIAILDMQPDVIVNVMGIALHRRAYIHAAILGVPMAVILTESPYMDDFHAEMIHKGYVKLAFANDRVSVEPLTEATGVDVRYLPHSFDPARHYPHQVGKEFQSDVFFYGTLWPARQELFGQLDLGAYDAHVAGTDFSKTSNEDPQIVSNDDMALWYSGTKVALNSHRIEKYKGGVVDGAYSLGPRAFEIAACGAFQLCDDTRPELAEVFGDSVATYRDAGDLQDKIVYYLAHDTERQAMAAESLRRVQPCSFLNRAREIVMPALEQMLGG